MLWGSTLDLLNDTAKTFLPQNASECPHVQEDLDEARQRFRSAVRMLGERNIQTCEDGTGAEERYLALRGKWISTVRAFAETGGYSWDAISSRVPQGAIEENDAPRGRK